MKSVRTPAPDVTLTLTLNGVRRRVRAHRTVSVPSVKMAG